MTVETGEAGATRWRTVFPRRVETTITGILAIAGIVAVVALAAAGASWLGYAGPTLVVVAAVVSFRSPTVGLGVVAFAPVAVWLAGDVPVATWSMVCFAAFLLAFRGLSWLLVGGVLAALNFVSGALVTGTVDVQIDVSASVFAFAAFLLAVIGSSVRGNLLYRDAAEQRIRDAETVRTVSVERGIAQERLRIARDLHDSVGHQIAVVSMRLGAAEVHLPAGADAARADIEAARNSVQAVLRETQQILAVLRSEGDETGASEGTDHLIADVVAGYRDAGKVVEVDDTALALLDRSLSAPVRLAAYRIVQEALTNAYRHGDGQVAMAIGWEETAVVQIDVVNARSTGGGSRGGGNGLIGMRERAASVGGSVDIRPDGTLFWVTARLPRIVEEER